MQFSDCTHIYQSRMEKITQAVWEASVSWHNEGPIEGPLKHLNTIVLWWSEGFQEGPELSSHVAERRQSLGQLYVWSRCSFSSLLYPIFSHRCVFATFAVICCPEVPPLCRETQSLGQQMLRKRNGGKKWVKCNIHLVSVSVYRCYIFNKFTKLKDKLLIIIIACFIEQ